MCTAKFTRTRDLCTPLALCVALLTLPSLALAQAGPPADTLEPLVVSASQTPMLAFDVPASISVVDGKAARAERLGVNLSESMGAVPGLVDRGRQNYAQDEQVQIRGFGARSSFGLRGIRVYVDGIPSTLPDGQGWVSNIDIGSVDRVEILRGPYSALYGNSSGGVIQVFTQPGQGPATIAPSFAAGSNGQIREAIRAAGSSGSVGYDVDLTHFQTDGYRDHSAAVRNFGNARFDLAPDEKSHLMFVINSVASPTAQDPMGLTRTNFNTNPRMVEAVASQYNTRKSFDQTQTGALYERSLGADDSIAARVYFGTRNAEQFQGILASAQGPTSPGAVIDLGRQYQGTDLHWTHRVIMGPGPLTLTAGTSYDSLDERRRGYLNFLGSSSAPTALGVTGALRRNEFNTVRDLDQYVQALWQFLPAWDITAGVRRSRLQFGSTDQPIAGAGTTSSSAPYAATLPVAGLEFAASDQVRIYGNAARGFETPTLNELAYRPGNAPGLNFALQPDHSDNYEIGIKARWAAVGQVNAAVFRVDTQSEIVTQTNTGGHAVYQNAGDTRREGAEFAWQRELGSAGQTRITYTYIDAFYASPFLTCLTTGCAAPNKRITAGNAIPSIARSTGYAELAWKPVAGWQAGIEARASSRLYVDDINSQAAPGYAIASLRAGYRLPIDRWNLSAFARCDNVLDRHYAGSVIVDETNSRFFEPAPGRTYVAGASASYTF
jgi:iron complex outermembrane receptor protein